MVNAGDGVRATVRAGDGNRTRMTSLEGWDSAIELRPQSGLRLSEHPEAFDGSGDR
jgi:hypothetical protein